LHFALNESIIDKLDNLLIKRYVMAQIKIDKSSLVIAAKKKMKPDRKNVTFRIDVDLYESFKKECERQKVTPTFILEEFFKAFK